MVYEGISAWHVASFRGKKKRDSFGSEVDAWKAEANLPNIEIKELLQAMGSGFGFDVRRNTSTVPAI